MARAGVSDQDGLFLHPVAALAVGFTRIYRVFKVEAAADGESLHEFVAHYSVSFVEGVGEGGLSRVGWWLHVQREVVDLLRKERSVNECRIDRPLE